MVAKEFTPAGQKLTMTMNPTELRGTPSRGLFAMRRLVALALLHFLVNTTASSSSSMLANDNTTAKGANITEHNSATQDDDKPFLHPQDHQIPDDDLHLSSKAIPLSLSDLSDCTCESRRHHRGRWSSTASRVDGETGNDTEGTPARIFYLVVIHNERTLEDAVSLFRAIRSVHNIIVIHVDVKFDYEKHFVNSELDQEIQACPCGSTVETASIHNSTWSTWSMNLPTIWGMQRAVKDYAGRWDVFVNLSGDSLPVYSATVLARYLHTVAVQPKVNFVTSSSCETGLLPTPISYFPRKWHKRGHYSHQPAHLDFMEYEYSEKNGKITQEHRRTNVTMEIYFGSQWMILQPDFCKHLIRELERPDSLASQFRDYLIRTKKLMSDETFIPTLLMYRFPESMPQLNETDSSLLVRREADGKETYSTSIPSIYDIRYERMDEHVPSSHGYYPTHQRYEVPNSSKVEAPRPWGPYFLGVYDLKTIRSLGALYIRKVSQRIDPNLYNLLPVNRQDEIPPIGWPAEVQVSPVPNWEKTLAELRRLYEEKKKHDHETDAMKGAEQELGSKGLEEANSNTKDDKQDGETAVTNHHMTVESE